MNWELRRAGGGPPKSAFWASLVLHVAVLAALVLGRAFQPEPLDFVTYEIRMVSLPAERAPEERPEPATEELVVETPDPMPPQPEAEELPPPPPDDPDPLPEPEPDPPEPEPDPVAEDPDPESAEETTPPRTEPEPEEEPVETPSADVNVRMEGLRRDFPEYYRNILLQIERCFRAPGGARSLTTVLYFEIKRDGTVSGTEIVQRSGNPQFDLAALAAVADCAGRNGRFGPLPEELPYDRLPVQFTFRPPNDALR